MRKPGKSLLRFGLTLVVLYALVCVGARYVSTWMLFPVPPPTYGEKLRGLVMISGADGRKYAAVHLPNPAAKQIILLFHGNGDDLGPTMGRIEALNARGFAVLAVDYAGYGLSDGKASESGLYAAADAAYAQVTGPLGWAPEKVIAHGVSLGGAASMWVAYRHNVGGLIMESSFMSAYRPITGYPLVLGDRMPNLARMKQVRCPVLVIHGFDDGLISWEHGRRLFEAAPEPKRSFWVPGAGHNNVISTAGDPYWRAIAEFAAGL
jgi:pimeloyl-ACP methyl ester carboxylesterase